MKTTLKLTALIATAGTFAGLPLAASAQTANKPVDPAVVEILSEINIRQGAARMAGAHRTR